MRGTEQVVAGVMALVAGVAGCTEHPYGARLSPAQPSSSAAPAGAASWAALPASVRPDEASVMEALGASAVLSSQPARRVLYTWTSEEQGQRLRADRVLLVKSSSDGPGMSRLDTSLWDSYTTDPWARVLMNPPFHRGRYAWVTPWATRVSVDDHPYGDVLVRVELKPEAIVASYRPDLPLPSRWSFHGLDGRVMSSAEALAAAGRIGAIHHARGDGLREYRICNEAMVASWSLATDEVRAAIEASQHTLDLLARFTRGRPGWQEWLTSERFVSWRQETARTWFAAVPPTSIEGAYAASLAFAMTEYQPAEGTLVVLEDEMRAAATRLASQGPALEHHPAATPPGRVTVPAPVPVRPRLPCGPKGTMGCGEPASLPCRDGSGRIVPCPSGR